MDYMAVLCKEFAALADAVIPTETSTAATVCSNC
jgi:hypothetical protein